jgi:tetratricopeptide (TPR) repeat protein
VHAGGGSRGVVLSVFSSYRCHFYREVDRLNSLSLLGRMGLPWLSAFSLLLVMGIDSGAQAPHAGGQELLHGSIFSAQGQPAAEAAVELRDLRGIRVASALTDGSGNFQIHSAAAPGEYVFLATSGYQIRYEQVLLAQAGLELSLALPADSVSRAPGGGRYVVSAKQLGVPSKARERLVAAQESFRKLKFDQAEQDIDGALRADSAFAAAFTMRAFIRLAQKDVHRAVEDARHAVLLDAEDAESFVALATSYNSLREFEKAEDAAWHALSLRPDCWQGRLELAKTLYGQGRFVVALREMDELHQDFPDVHLVRANVLARLNRAQEAAEEFERFLQQAPDDPRSEHVKRIVAQVAAPTPSFSTQH